jgi:peptide subunit release factor 1 (eRF1)
VYLEEVEDEIEIKNGYPGRTAAGGWAQSRYQRHREAHLHTHVLKAVDALAQEQRRRGFDRILVGGPDEARAALLGALPRGLRSRVSGTFSCELLASHEAVLKRTRKLMEAAEREAEETLVEHLLGAAKSGGLAATGWEETLAALFEGRVHKLVLVDRLRKRGRSCPGGHMAVGRGPRICSLCDEPVGASRDLAEAAVGAALDTQASVEMVRGSAAQQLRREGGIGAILRY